MERTTSKVCFQYLEYFKGSEVTYFSLKVVQQQSENIILLFSVSPEALVSWAIGGHSSDEK